MTYYDELAQYNAAVSGLFHTPETRKRMEGIQTEFHADQAARFIAMGATPFHGGWLIPEQPKRRWWSRRP